MPATPMSMNALSESDCQEILEEFRSRLPNASVALLTELAFNYGLDAPVDLDPMDVASILAHPGPTEVFSVVIDEQRGAEAGFYDLMSNLRDQGESLSTCGGVLLIVKARHIDLAAYGRVISALNQGLHPQTLSGHALYCVKNTNAKVSLTLIVVGIGSLNEFADQHQSVSNTWVFDEIPVFLQPHGTRKNEEDITRDTLSDTTVPVNTFNDGVK